MTARKEKTTVTHIAGPALRFYLNGEKRMPRIIQRCSVCGEKLVDNIRTSVPLDEHGRATEIGTWEVGVFVQVTAGNPTQYTTLPDTDKIPDDSCLELVED
jgi:hypothetical protein